MSVGLTVRISAKLIVVYIATLVLPLCGAFVVDIRPCQYGCLMRSSSSSSCTTRVFLTTSKRTTMPESSSSTFLTIPVFPLRKSVKLPTETLTLNLYEERYLRMSDYIININDRQNDDDEMLFGALYCSDKPQIVHGGNGPIVPMVEVGDIGVIFKVLEHTQGMIPTVGGEGFSRFRSRLNGVGIGRFKVTKILQAGYKKEFPFILVEADQVEDLEEDIIDLRASLDKCLLSSASTISDESFENEAIDPIVGGLDQTLQLDAGNASTSYDDDNELYSFMVASRLKKKLSPQELVSLLGVRSTKSRLATLSLLCEQQRPAIFASLFQRTIGSFLIDT